MIKAMMHGKVDGDVEVKPKVLILGLSHMNLELLAEGKPIYIKTQELVDLGLETNGIDILIIADETEEKMLSALEARCPIEYKTTVQ